MDFCLFAQHQVHSVYLDAHSKFDILCVESLTPVDMVNLGSGLHDATGHLVWSGACCLVACLPQLRSRYFINRRVIELGCGTGIGGLSLLIEGHKDRELEAATPASFVAFTDSDPEALALCQRNCKLNQLSNDCYSVIPLTWGQDPMPSVVKHHPFDTVLATDVLYDIGLLPHLFQTAADCLVHTQNNGIFVLAHVPRACYNSVNPPVDNLETHIVERAKEFGLMLEELLRPSSCRAAPFPKDALNHMSLQEMEEIGAAIFVFRSAGQTPTMITATDTFV
jgi:predicted nicotinamide N-methyase